MAEQELLTPNKIAEKIKEIINSILTTGDWECSIFLKASIIKLRKLLTEAEQLSHLGEQAKQDQNTIIISKNKGRGSTPPGYCQTFILLYQVDSADLQGWYNTIKTLTGYSVTRPVYKNETYAREFISSKTSGIERNGYAVVNVKIDDFYNNEEQPQLDGCGHQLFVLKENSIKLENIIEFVLANKQNYAVGENALILLDEKKD